MKTDCTPSLLRALALMAASLGCLAMTAAHTATARRPGQAAFADLLLASAAWLLLGCVAWATVLAAALLGEAVSRGRVRASTWVGCPPTLRRAVLVGLGMAVASTGPAAAAERRPAGRELGPDRAQSLPVPARPTGSPASPQPERSWELVRVRAGDTLWGVVATRAPHPADAGTIATLVARTHRHNRAVIGPDPDHIEPGQHLAVPTPKETT